MVELQSFRAFLPESLIWMQGAYKKRNRINRTWKECHDLAGQCRYYDRHYPHERPDKERGIDINGRYGIPPLSTHDGFKPIQNNPRG